MKTISYEQFVKDYNKHYFDNVGFVSCSTLEIDSIIEEVYNSCDYELNEDLIVLYDAE